MEVNGVQKPHFSLGSSSLVYRKLVKVRYLVGLMDVEYGHAE